jgi:hypothetical protein
MPEPKVGLLLRLLGKIVLRGRSAPVFSLAMPQSRSVAAVECVLRPDVTGCELGITAAIGAIPLDWKEAPVRGPDLENFGVRVNGAALSLNLPAVKELAVFSPQQLKVGEFVLAIAAETGEILVPRLYEPADLVRAIPLERIRAPRVAVLDPRIAVAMHEDHALIRRMRVIKRPLLASFLSKDEQLRFWKLALKKSGKNVKELTFGAVFRSVPTMAIDNLSYDGRRHLLFYSFKTAFNPLALHLKKVGAFIENESNNVLFVSYD